MQSFISGWEMRIFLQKKRVFLNIDFKVIFKYMIKIGKKNFIKATFRRKIETQNRDPNRIQIQPLMKICMKLCTKWNFEYDSVKFMIFDEFSNILVIKCWFSQQKVNFFGNFQKNVKKMFFSKKVVKFLKSRKKSQKNHFFPEKWKK